MAGIGKYCTGTVGLGLKELDSKCNKEESKLQSYAT